MCVCVCLVSVQRKRTSSFLSLCLCLSFIHSFSVFFFTLSFPLQRLFCALSLSLCHSPLLACGCVSCGCFLFFSLSLSRAAGFVSHLFWLGSAGVALQSLMDCQRPTEEVNTKAFSQPGAVTFYWSPSIRRRIGTPILFWVSQSARDAFRHHFGICRYCYYCSMFDTVLLVKLNYHSNWLNNSNHNKWVVFFS
jgi:hypothetical protein